MNLLTNRCGTYSSVWLNKQHPSSDQGIITCEVCANVFNITVECPWPWNIRVKNCGGFFVYELKATPYCPMRYCTSIWTLWKAASFDTTITRLKETARRETQISYRGLQLKSVMQEKKQYLQRDSGHLVKNISQTRFSFSNFIKTLQLKKTSHNFGCSVRPEVYNSYINK